MGRKGPRVRTKIVLKSVKQWEQLGDMHNLKFQTFLNKNHPVSGKKTKCVNPTNHRAEEGELSRERQEIAGLWGKVRKQNIYKM